MRSARASSFRLLRGTLARLQSTVIRTTIRQGEHWRRQQFSWINEWEELADARGHCHGVEFVLPEWFYRGVLDRSLVLTIDPAYFALTGGIERWLYRIARRHAGRQPQGWAFELRHLYAKSGSAARFSDFALDVEGGQLSATLAPLASDTVTTILGFTEISAGQLYNSAAVFHQGAVAGLYRKLHPAIRKSIYRAGDRIRSSRLAV